MNPEDNNPLTNPGTPVPGMDTTNNSTSAFGGVGGYGAPDMSASFSVQNPAGPDMSSMGEVVNNGFESTDTTLETPSADASLPTDEPLVPAAPVPGSIGSAISAPPVAPAPAAPVAAPSFTAGTTPGMGTGPMPAPAVAPQGATTANATTTTTTTTTTTPGFTPFNTTSATSAAPAPASTTAPVAASTTPTTPVAPTPGINPAFQPVAKPGKKSKVNFEFGSKRASIILLIVAALFMVSTVVMTVLYFQAAKQKKQIVYTPSPDQSKVTTKEVLRCSGEDNFGYLVGSGDPIMGSKSLAAGYIDGNLSGITVGFSIPFPDEGLAIAGKDALALEQATLLANVGDSFLSNYWTYGNTAEAIVTTKAGFENKDAIMFLYGLTDSETSTDLETLQEKYESEGMVCEVK